MQYEATGKVVALLPQERGEGRRGPWTKMAFVIKTTEQYPMQMHFELWNDRIDEYADLLSIDKPEAERPELLIKFTSESTEYKGRYYTKNTAFYIRKADAAAPAASAPTDPERDIEDIRAELTNQMSVNKK